MELCTYSGIDSIQSEVKMVPENKLDWILDYSLSCKAPYLLIFMLQIICMATLLCLTT